MLTRLMAAGAAAMMALGAAQASAPGGVFFSGNDLYTRCSPTPNNTCAAYVGGAADMLTERSQEAVFCLNDQVTLGQVTDVVRKYLADHPEQRHHPAARLVAVALGHAFPCPK